MKIRGNEYSSRRTIISILIVLVVIVIALILFFTLGYNKDCKNYECFAKAMSSCKKATYINEEPDASWGYTVKGSEGDSCKVNVKLLQAKEGELGIDKLEGYDMDCYYAKGISAYPEKDLSACHGRLKEEVQSIIIQKLHTYVLENVGKFDDSLGKFL